MKTFGKCLFTASVVFALAMTVVSAQAAGGHKHKGDTAKADTQKPKADEKAYAQAIGSLPDKSYDPWNTLR